MIIPYILVFLCSFCITSVSFIVPGKQLRSSHVTYEASNQKDLSSYQSFFPDITDTQWQQLEALIFKLTDWNAKVNLISRKDIEYLVPNHIIPCLAVSLVKRFSSGEKVIDVGTGGGLPGLPMAICCPNASFTLLDSNTKKMAIVEDIRSSLGLSNVKVVRARAEAFQERFDFMLGRAVSAVPTFLGFSSHFLDINSLFSDSGLLYIKGGDFFGELKEAGIDSYRITEVNKLVTLNSDKNVLYIPASEVQKFHSKKLLKDQKDPGSPPFMYSSKPESKK